MTDKKRINKNKKQHVKIALSQTTSKHTALHTFHAPIPISQIIFCNHFYRYNSFNFYTLQSKIRHQFIFKTQSAPRTRHHLVHSKSKWHHFISSNFWHLFHPFLTPILTPFDSNSAPKPTIFYDKKNHFPIPVNRLKSMVLALFPTIRMASPDIHNNSSTPSF